MSSTNNAIYEQQCERWHKDLLNEFEENNTSNLMERLNEIENVVNKECNKYSLKHNGFKIGTKQRQNLLTLYNKDLREHTIVSHNKCATAIKNLNQILLHTDSSRLRTPFSLGRGLRTETPFIIKLHDEPVEGDEGSFRAFFARLIDELQFVPSNDSNQTIANKTLSLLVPSPNQSYFIINPCPNRFVYYLQSQTFCCLGRIIGISIRCSMPLHFQLPIWIWILCKNIIKYKTICPKFNNKNNDFNMFFIVLKCICLFFVCDYDLNIPIVFVFFECSLNLRLAFD